MDILLEEWLMISGSLNYKRRAERKMGRLLDLRRGCRWGDLCRFQEMDRFGMCVCVCWA